MLIAEANPNNIATLIQKHKFKIANYQCHTNIEENTCKRGVCVYTRNLFYILPNSIDNGYKVEESGFCEMKRCNNEKLLI